jgi:uncharacterized delta-60 repeat protein
MAVLAAFFMLRASASAELDSSFVAQASHSVASIAVQPDGKVLIGGAFTQVSGQARNYLARLHADGTVDATFAPNPGRDVAALAVQADGKVLVGGYFATIAGTERHYLARLNADGTLDGSFADAGVVGAAVYGLHIQPDGKILLIGDFSQVGGTARTHVARLNSDGSLDSGFAPTVNNRVYGITRLSTGQILISGAFTEVSGAPRERIARLNADGTLDTSFNPAANADVLSMVEQADGRIIMTGNFTTVNGVTRNRIARLLPDGTLDPAYDPDINVQGVSMALQTDGRLVLVGWFTFVGGAWNPYLVRLNPDGSRDTSFTAYSNDGGFAAAAQADGRLLLGGLFTSVNSTSALRIARLLNEPATQTMTVTSPARVEWLRGGTAPETSRVTFELSTNGGGSYTTLGAGARIGGGWELTGLALPTSGRIRARAFPTSGYFNGSSGLVEQVMTYDLGGMPGSTDYQKLAQAMDGGGSRGGSANYTHDGSTGGWAGLSTVASPSETAKHGYIGQLYDVTGLQLAATPATVNESATRQLTAAQVMDDATTLPVLASSITWSVQSGPLTGIDANGLATAGAVYQDTLATAQGAYAGATGSLGLTVLDTIPDNFGTYAADGIGDDWQHQYFGASNPNAGPSFDPDFDGHDNLFEFTAGLDPLSSTSRFLMINGRPADQPGRMSITIHPRLNDRTYTVKSSLTLGPGSTWAPLTSFTVSDDGLTRTITDTNAVEGAKFYKVEITKP